MKKLNLGCGNDYRKGWINLDFNKDVKADFYCDINGKLPFNDNEFDYIYIDNVLEHIKEILNLFDELYRISKDGAIFEIYVPHYSGIYALKHLTHYHYFGIGSLDIMRTESLFNKERYTKARFILLKEELIFIHHNSLSLKSLNKLHFNWIFNLSRPWQLFLERFFVFGFDEIYYKVKVFKKKN
jgi:ubiquinone/menaquinone biosynthesis C-methylase UbiE